MAREPITLKDIDLENHLISIIKTSQMTKRAFSNVSGNVREVFLYARRQRYIQSSPVDMIDMVKLKRLCLDTVPKADEDRILTIEEINALKESVMVHLARHPYYMPDYAIRLAIMIGPRVGELAALKWDAIRDGFLYIELSEHRNDHKDKTCELVISLPKNKKIRRIPLTVEMKELFDEIRVLNLKGEFIFTRFENGERYTSHDISCACDRRVREAGIPDGTSIHEIRRTVSSYLNTVLPREAVANMIGHTPETNEKCYDYDGTSSDAKIIALDKWLSA